eukprot:TRINITY_DN80_c0_g1_i2.p3 TRINITY_DN80_c0_g1~~TRINITY_DN80_c0_g1_i2.p3  ORF type:complete len:150 (+),score=10.26 TRINITY_DN80_c0_g1_i2:111-560(+)
MSSTIVFQTSFSGVKIQKHTFMSCRTRTQMKCVADISNSRRQMLSLGAAFVAVSIIPNAKADLIADLKAKSDTNKDLRKKQRLATSYANLARSRTVSDGTCAFPYNFAGCEEITNINQGVKFLSDDINVECEGKEGGKCASKPDFSLFK